MIVLKKTHAEQDYKSDCGHTMAREDGKTPLGHPMEGRWVLRDPDGNYIGHDQYRNDLAEQHNFKLSSVQP
jgi:hypothetical protein